MPCHTKAAQVRTPAADDNGIQLQSACYTFKNSNRTSNRAAAADCIRVARGPRRGRRVRSQSRMALRRGRPRMSHRASRLSHAMI